jgi:DNA repair exonuclease SbcCD ATPase subunit
MKIESISFKNIFAYGEDLQTVNYSDNGELILLKGESGAGKTAVLSLPCLLLYGRIEKTPKNSIANRVNKNGFIHGELSVSGHKYVIERGFLPNTLKVFKDGVDIENIGIKDAQSYIDTEIIDIPQVTFNNMISISMKKFKSFLTMSPADRKQIIDRIFDLEIVNVMYEAVKKDARDLGNQINADNTAVFQITKTLANAQQELQRIVSGMQQSEDNQKINDNLLEIDKCNQKIAEEQANYNGLYQQYNKIQNDIKEYSNQKQTVFQNIKQLNEKINLFKQERCPTCGTPFQTGNFETIKQNLNKLLVQQTEIQNNLDLSIKQSQQSGMDMYTQLTTIYQSIQGFNQSIQKLTAENTKIKAVMESSTEYTAIQKIIESTELQMNTIKQSIKEKTDKIGMLDYLLQIYSVDGVKQKVINSYIPILNKEIDENLELLNFPYQLEFDSKFDSTLKDMGLKVPVETLSDGEMTRVDIVVLCSLFKLLKMRYPSINILSIDELVSFLDVNNSQILLKFLKVFATELKLNIFVVSHVNIDTEYFDRCIEVTRGVNGFSHLSEENMLA